jgi:hypothetical protein
MLIQLPGADGVLTGLRLKSLLNAENGWGCSDKGCQEAHILDWEGTFPIEKKI